MVESYKTFLRDHGLGKALVDNEDLDCTQYSQFDTYLNGVAFTALQPSVNNIVELESSATETALLEACNERANLVYGIYDNVCEHYASIVSKHFFNDGNWK